MPTDRPLDNRISRWLEAEAPTQLPDRVLRATFERTRRTRQEASWQQVLRRLQMNRMIFGLGGAAVVVLAAVLALGLYFNSPGVGTPPSPSPTIAPSPDPTSARTSTPDAGLPLGPLTKEDNGVTFTITIPASGWRDEDIVLFKGVEVANLPEAGLLFWAWPADTEFYVYRDPCRSTSTRPDTPVTAVDDFAAALAAQASRDASEPMEVMVGGYAGKSIVLHAPLDADFFECEEHEFVSYGTEQDPLTRYHQGPGQIDELWILDVDGSIVILNAMYRPDTSADLVEEMRAIIESTTFDTP